MENGKIERYQMRHFEKFSKNVPRTQTNEIFCASFCTLRHGQSQWVKNQFLSHKNCIIFFLLKMKLFPVKMRYFWCQNSFTLSETFGADFQPLCLMVKDFSLLLVSWCKKQKKSGEVNHTRAGTLCPAV